MPRTGRIIGALAVAVAVFAATGCGSGDDDPTTPAPNGQQDGIGAPTPAIPTNPAGPGTGDLDGLPSSPSGTPGQPGAAANPSDFADGSGYYFASPSGKWKCGILPRESDSTTGCHGPFPANVPNVPGSGAPDTMVRPNTVMVSDRNEPAAFRSIGDAQFYPDSRQFRTLPYGTALTVGPFRCSVAESTGVTCDNTTTSRGFTISDTAYQLR